MRRANAALAAVYLTYFAAMGLLQPFLPVHLSALGYSAAAIGGLLALWNGARIVGPLLVATRADAGADPRRLLRALGAASVVAALALALARAPLAVGVALVGLSLAYQGFMPLFEAHVLERLGARAGRYGRFRLWGSVGYILSATAAGALVARVGAAAIPSGLVALVAASVVALYAVAALPGTRRQTARPPRFAAVLRAPGVLRFLAVCFLHLAGFGAYYGFYSLYLLRAGHSSAAVGVLWATGVVAEIGMFLAGRRLVARYALPRLVQVALGATVLRWAVLAACPGALALQLVAQLLHAAGFGLFHTASVLYVPALLPDGAGARGQALVSSVGWGAGGMAGSVLAGVVWDGAGPAAMFAVAAALAVAALGVASGLPGAPGPGGRYGGS